VGWVWASGPTNPNCCLLMYSAKHTFMPLPCIFIPVLFWYLAKRVLFRYQKIPEKFGCFLLIYLWAPRTLFFSFFFLSFVFFSAPCLIYGLLLLNTNLLCNAFFYSCLKRANKKKKGKKGIEYFFSSLKIQNFTNLFTWAKVRNIALSTFV